jgi:uncharacterized protein YmfQ (DUF2313 family)
MKNIKSALYRLLPTGRCWAPEKEDTNLRRFIYGIAESVIDLQIELQGAMDDYYPGQAGIFLEDWEALLKLPKCGQAQEDLQSRINTILAMLRMSPYSNEEFFVGIASTFGYDIDIVPDGPDYITVSDSDYGLNGQYNKTTDIINKRLSYRLDGGNQTIEFGSTVDSVTTTPDILGWQLRSPAPGGTAIWYVSPTWDMIVPTDGWQLHAAAGTVITVELDPNFTPASPYTINIKLPSNAVVHYFTVGASRAGDPLIVDAVDTSVKCLLEFFKPAHATINYI